MIGEALQRLAQFFVAPLFIRESMEAESRVFDKELLEIYVMNDVHRLAHFERTVGKAGHPFSRFAAGTRETLWDKPLANGLDPREEALRFFKKYSSNLMTFCIKSNHSLDELEKLVVPILSAIEDKSVAPTVWRDHPYGDEQLGFFFQIVPVGDLQQLKLWFPIPDITEQFRSKPADYVAYILEYGGPGGLLHQLRSEDWATSLVAGAARRARGFGFFDIEVSLTNEGLNHWVDIVERLFAYLAFVKLEKPQEYIHHDCAKKKETNFLFKEDDKAVEFVVTMAHMLQIFPPEQVFRAQYAMPEYKPKLIESLMDKLIPSKMNVAVLSKSFKGKTSEVEPWYRIEFNSERIADAALKRFTNAKTKTGFQLPPENPWFPTKFCSVKTEKTPVSNRPCHLLPELLPRTDGVVLYHAVDDEFYLPKSFLTLHLQSPLISSNAASNIMNLMLADLFRDQAAKEFFDYVSAGLNFSMETSKYGLVLQVSGFCDKLPKFLEYVTDALRDFKPNAVRFELLRRQLATFVEGFPTRRPMAQAVHFESLLLSEISWSNDEEVKAAGEVTVEKLTQFVAEFLTKVSIDAIVYGNANEADAQRLIAIFLKSLASNKSQFSVLPSDQIRRCREVLIQNGASFVFEPGNNAHEKSALLVVLQMGVDDPHKSVLAGIILRILEASKNEDSKLKALGEIKMELRRRDGTLSLRITVQGDSMPEIAEANVESFLQSVEQKITSIGEEEFKLLKDQYIMSTIKEPKTMAEQSDSFLEEFVSRNFKDFHRGHDERIETQTIASMEILSFYRDFVISLKRRKLIIRIRGAKSMRLPAVGTLKMPAAQLIGDVDSFKKSQAYY